VVAAIHQGRLEARDRVPGQHAAAHGLFDAAPDGLDVFFGDGPANDLVLENKVLRRVFRERLELHHHVAVLAGAAGLAHEAPFRPDGAGDRLAVGDARLAHPRPDLELAQHPVDQHLQVQLAHAVDQRLADGLIHFDDEGRVFLGQLAQGLGHLVLVGLGLRLDRHRDHRLREGDRFEQDRGVGV